jgi:hypothetical protein
MMNSPHEPVDRKPVRWEEGRLQREEQCDWRRAFPGVVGVQAVEDGSIVLNDEWLSHV